MSVDKLSRLREHWQKDRQLQTEINAAFDSLGFSERYVSKVTSPQFDQRSNRKSKQIKDNQWGMIEFDWRAMRLVDSPLLQRLRYVKQLGFTYLTYPSAEHSRFSHTLGVGHVVTKFIEAIDKRAAEVKISGDITDIEFVCFDKILDLSADDVIHAALLHDVGHLPFSHVTEKIIETRSESFTCAGRPLAQVIYDANSILNTTVKFSEILTLILILSQRFERFYRDFVRAEDPERDEALARIGSLIVGLPPSPALTGLPELISSASVDADKVDYVNRDALNCGVPVGVDVARIFLRSGIVRAKRDQIKQLNLKEDPLPEEFLFVVNSSGIDTIDEILQARTALYQRVYFHAVTRTAERLLSLALEANATNPHPDGHMVDALTLWAQKDSTLLDRLANSLISNVKEPALQIVNRQFPKKSYSFSPAIAGLQMPLNEIFPKALESSVTEIKKQVNNTTIEQNLRDEQLWKGTSAGIEKAIADETTAIVAALVKGGKNEFVPSTPNGKLPPTVLIVGTAHEKQKRHNQIISQNDRLLTLREYTNAREQQDAFELLKEVGFVLCEEEWRYLVFFAARIVLARLAIKRIEVELKFNRRTSNELQQSETVSYITRFLPEYSLSALRSGLANRSMKRLADALIGVGYFEDKPWACEPVATANADVIAIARKLRTFDGYRSWTVSESSVAAFLSQFPPKLRTPMAQILRDKLDFLSAQRAVDLLGPMLGGMGSIQVVPFSPSSGNQIWMWLRNELASINPDVRFASDLHTALEASAPIVLVDDNATSGVQARAQFLHFLGVPRDQWPEECREEDNLSGKLNEDEAEKLRQRETHLFVCAGSPGVEEKLRVCLAKVGFTGFAGFKFGAGIGADFEWPLDLKAFISDVGEYLLAWAKFRGEPAGLTDRQREECRKNSFGYSNAGALLVTSLSVPTGTVTPLWQPGVYRGQPWMPLAIRTNKLRHLVIG